MKNIVTSGGVQCPNTATMLGELIAVQYAKSLIDTFKDDISADRIAGKRIAVVLSGGRGFGTDDDRGSMQPAQLLVPFQ